MSIVTMPFLFTYDIILGSGMDLECIQLDLLEKNMSYEDFSADASCDGSMICRR